MTRPDPAAPASSLRSSERVDGKLRLTLANDRGAIEAARLAILPFLEPLALDPLVTNRIEVVFEEALSNILRHGFTPGSDQAIVVSVASGPTAVVLTIEDDGIPFNPLAAPEPPPLTSLETAPLGGLGIALMRKLAADMRYESPTPDPAAVFRPRNRLTIAVATGR
jgi:anti-sigma regulatory factor (Ser/Thr protein kinase)